MKRIIAAILTVCCLFPLLSAAGPETARAANTDGGAYKTGDYVEFGSYPQKLVRDEGIIAALNRMDLQWTPGGEHVDNLIPVEDEENCSLTISTGSGVFTVDPENPFRETFRYAEATYNGQRYRGLTLETDLALKNGYRKNTVYWFLYRPLVWRVLDPETGFLLCEPLIDAVPWYVENVPLSDRSWGWDAKPDYSYVNSYIRSWLNRDFYDAAFTEEEKAQILLTENPAGVALVGRDAWDDEDVAFHDEEAADRVFLLSAAEILDKSYGFRDYYSMWARGTDYALSQGLYYCLDNETPDYWASDYTLRTCAFPFMRMTAELIPREKISQPYAFCDETEHYGTRPAIKVSSLSGRVSPHQHQTASLPGIEASCLKYGCKKIRQCAACLHLFGAPEKTEPLGHQFNGEGATLCVRGDAVRFGSYPQERVYNPELEQELNALPLSWKSFGFYTGNGEPGSQKQGDCMEYADVEWEGQKYRAVRINECRPFLTYEKSSAGSQNGYEKGQVYWFRYMPIVWVILDRDAGLVVSDAALDANPYCYESTVLRYATSDIRTWLNTSFYDLAFSEEEKKLIRETSFSVTGVTTAAPAPGDEVLTDRVFLLSEADVTNTAFGFSETDGYPDYARDIQATDYAKAMGNDNHFVSAQWALRVNGNGNICYVYSCFGYLAHESFLSCGLVNMQDNSVRPALRIDFSRFKLRKVLVGDVDWDGRITASDARLALRRAVELEIYPKGSALFLACDVDHSDRVNATDARLILRAAVGLENPDDWDVPA